MKKLISLNERFKVLEKSNSPIENLFEVLCRFHAEYCKITKKNAENFRIGLMELYHTENQKKRDTHAKTEPAIWKYTGAALQVAGGLTGLRGVKAASDGLAGVGTGLSNVGDTRDKHYQGLRTVHEHKYSNLKTFLDRNERTTSNAYSHIESLSRLFADFVSKGHQSKMEISPSDLDHALHFYCSLIFQQRCIF